MSKELIFFNKNEKFGVNLPILLVDQAENLDRIKGQGIIGLGRKEDSEFNLTILDALQ